MKPFYLSKLVVITTILLACGWQGHAQSVTFSTPGGPYAYTVPQGVTAIGVDVQGAVGGNSYPGGIGGKGGRVQATMAVTAGQVYYIFVGGKGGTGPGGCSSATAGINGGQPASNYYAGGSGGASDIRSVNGAYTLAAGLNSRVVVAGAGGGAGYYCYCTSDIGGDGGGVTGGNATYSGTLYNYDGQGGGQTLLANGSTYWTGSGTTYQGTLGVGGPTLNGCYYSAPGGAGYYGGGGASYYQGGGGGSSYPAANGGQISNLVHTQGFNTTSSPTTGNGIVILCAPNLGSILGNTPVCVGQVRALSSTGSGGTWSSSTPSVATVDGSGNVTGVSAGVSTITYAATLAGCGAGFLTAIVTVNPLPSAIIGTPNVCVGFSNTLTDGGGGTWTSSNSSLAAIGSSTGIVNGITAGSATVTYTLPVTGCYITTPFVVNPPPAGIVGASAVCAGGATTTMTDPTPGGTWTSSNPGFAAITSGSGIVTGGSAGIATLTYTIPSTGCYSTSSINVNALPAPIAGAGAVCAGSNTPLTDAGGGLWSSSNLSVAAVGPTGVVSGVGAGTATITYTLPTGCSITSSMLVNPLPAPITGTLAFCNGASSSLSSATPGGTWSSSNPSIATVVPTTGLVSSVTSGSPVISYTFLSTTCAVSQQITVNALPSAFSVTGGGGYCAGTGGVHIGLGLSTTGVSYKLYNGPTLVTTVGGSNSALDFGVYTAAGTYTAIGVDATTACTNNMAGSTTISVNPLPNTFNVTGGGNFCPGGTGVNVMQSGSDVGMNYQLKVGGVPTGAAMAGTGTPLDFGPQTTPGIYTVSAVSPTTGCSSNMVGSASVVLNLVPAVHTLNGGGSYCTGGSGVALTLDGSDASVNYQLYFGGTPTGAAMAGTGSALNFGLHTAAGSYSVVATSTSTGCVNNMAGTANIAVNSLPLVFFVTGGGGFCPGGPGAHVNLNYSTTGINYQLYRGATPVTGALIPGSNAGLDFGLQTVAGSYTVVGIDASTGCTKNMSGSANVFVNPLPASHNVAGGGAYCAGSAGRHVSIDGSNTGTTYQLIYAGAPLGSPVAGTGGAIDFGIQTGTGAYTVVGTNASTSCSANMAGAVNISVNPLPNIDSVVGAGTSYCAGGTGIDIMLTNSDAGVNYQLYRGGSLTGVAMPGTGAMLDFGMRTAIGLYTVVAIDATTGCQSPMAGGASVAINPAPAVYVVTGGGNFCAGGAGAHIGLSGSTLGVNYTLSGTGGVIGTFAGTGSALDFGLQTATGTYSVMATDAIAGCTSNMAGSPAINLNPLPVTYTVTGTGSYCAGSTGPHVYLSASTPAVHYQLYNGSTPVGLYQTGAGSSIDFGAHTAGSYTVKATNPSTGCTAIMASSADITANSLPAAQTVTGGGAYCAGGAGTDIGLGGSTAGVTYQLMHSGSGVGSPMMGTGASIDFGNQLLGGSYTVMATDSTTFCTSTMPGGVSVTVTPQPSLQTVTGGGAYCAGGAGSTIGLAGTDAGISYQLMSGGSAVGSLMTGTGGTLTFSSVMTGGTYTVVASPGGLCETTMTGSAVVTVSPLPTLHNVTGGGAYCATDSGLSVGLNSSNTGIQYQLLMGGTAVGSFVNGSGSALDFGRQMTSGVYTVVATDAITGCMATMTGSGTVTVKPVPAVYDVTGGGAYCAGGNGVSVLLNNSSTGVNYQLKFNGSSMGTPMPGTGTALNFGLKTSAGSYTVVGTDAATACSSNMADTAAVTVTAIVIPSVSVAAHPGLNIKMGQADTIVATVTNGGTSGALYQWSINGFPVAGATNSTFVSSNFVDGDVVSCTATSTGMCADMTGSGQVTIRVRNTVGVQPTANAASDIRVVPNPSKGIFTISGSLGTADETVNVEVMDVTGRVIYSDNVTATNGNINSRVQLSNAANGMYLLSLRSGVASQVFHIVVEQ